MKPMQAGKMEYRVLIQEDQGTTIDAAGSPVPNWVTVRHTWAAIEPIVASGRELFQGAQVMPDITHKITIRVNGNVPLNPSMRILFQGTRVFNIGSIANTEEKARELLILAKEQV